MKNEIVQKIAEHLEHAKSKHPLFCVRICGEGTTLENVKALLKRSRENRDNFKTADGAAAGWWWLRSPGFLQSDAAYVDYDGALYSRDAYYDGGGVRPAFWLNLESDIF